MKFCQDMGSTSVPATNHNVAISIASALIGEHG